MTAPRVHQEPDDLLAEFRSQQAPSEASDLLAEFAAQQGATQQGGESAAPAPRPYGIVNAAIEGASVGLSRPLTAAIEGAKDRLAGRAPDFGTAYSGQLRAYDRGKEAFAAAHPVVNLVSELGGAVVADPLGLAMGGVRSLATAGRAASAAKHVGLVGRAARGMATGSAYGAVAGAAGAEDGRALEGAVKGAGYGAAFGGAAGAAAPVVVEKGRSLLDAVTGRSGRTAAEKGERILAGAMRADGVDLAAELQAARAGTTPAGTLVVDRAPTGGSARQLVQGAWSIPGTGRSKIDQAIRPRYERQRAEVQGAVDAAFGNARPNAPQVAEQLAAEQSAKAAPLYAAAYAAHPVVDNPRINAMVKLPWFDRAWERAQQIAALEEHPLPQVFRPNAAGQLEQVAVPDLRTLHLLRQGLDDVLEYEMPAAVLSGGTNPTIQGLLKQKRGELNAILHGLSSELKTADETYGTYADMQRALARGKQFLQPGKSADVVADEFGHTSGAAQPVYRTGQQAAMRDALDNVRDERDALGRTYEVPALREKLRATLPAGAYDTYEGAMQRQQTHRDVFKEITAGPNTAQKLAAQEAFGGKVAGMPPTTSSGLAATLLRALQERRIARMRPAVADAVATSAVAGQGGTGELADALEALLHAEQRAPGNPETARKLVRVIGQLAGGAAAP